MTLPIPDDWRAGPPEILVVGGGPYSRGLAFVLGAALVGIGDLDDDPESGDDGGFPHVLGDLEMALIVAAPGESSGDLLRVHDLLWNWIQKLSPDGEEHLLKIVFVLPPAETSRLEHSLRTGLGLTEDRSESNGFGFASMDQALSALLKTLAAAEARDRVFLEARLEKDRRYRAIEALKKSLNDSEVDFVAVERTAREILEVVFAGESEYLLDIFCREPSHPNGSVLRRWLRKIVTGDVTPSQWQELPNEVSRLLK